MKERVWKCPSCGAVLRPSRFARTATCEYCHSVVEIDEAAVSAARFRAAREQWTAPRANDGREWFALGGDHWTRLGLVAHGEIADLHLVERARAPTERALLKVLRDPDDVAMLEREWKALTQARANSAPGSAGMIPRLPDPIARGVVDGGEFGGRPAHVLRWADGFEHTFEDVHAAFPAGIDTHAVVWTWRRLLELLAFLHRADLVHGAVLPQHLLIENGEHGVRLVGFGCAGRPGESLAAIVLRHERLYPESLLADPRLRAEHDVVMSARCVAVLANGSKAGPQRALPGRLADLLNAVAHGESTPDAWELRETIGRVASQALGPPSFHPLVLPTRRGRGRDA